MERICSGATFPLRISGREPEPGICGRASRREIIRCFLGPRDRHRLRRLVWAIVLHGEFTDERNRNQKSPWGYGEQRGDPAFQRIHEASRDRIYSGDTGRMVDDERMAGWLCLPD